MVTAGRVVTMGLTFQNVNKILDLCAHNIPTCTMYTHTQLLWTSWLTWHVRLVDTMYVAGLYEPSLSDGIFYEATYQMQLPILIRVEFEGTMLLETSKDFNAESLNRPIVTPRGAKNDVGKSPSGTRQASWEPWWAVNHATGVVSAQKGRGRGQ